MMLNQNRIAVICVCTLIFFAACKEDPTKSLRKKINLKSLFSKLKREKATDASDTTNLFDNDNYDPATIDSAEIIKSIETMYESDSAMLAKIKPDAKGVLDAPSDSLSADTNAASCNAFTNDIKKTQSCEVVALKNNLEQVKNALTPKPLDSTTKNLKRAARQVWADVSKTDQRLYLYINGACVDTFKVSTGSKGHETPLIDRQPSGPAFRKYTSKKYPGGNYNGLGNMPYVVFVQGGYGIHGTTLGNIPKLGKKASHGCVRVHPDDAKIFNELVLKAGVENTWVTIRE